MEHASTQNYERKDLVKKARKLINQNQFILSISNSNMWSVEISNQRQTNDDNSFGGMKKSIGQYNLSTSNTVYLK